MMSTTSNAHGTRKNLMRRNMKNYNTTRVVGKMSNFFKFINDEERVVPTGPNPLHNR